MPSFPLGHAIGVDLVPDVNRERRALSREFCLPGPANVKIVRRFILASDTAWPVTKFLTGVQGQC